MEKIIQIVYATNDSNPTVLTDKGRILKVCYNGKTHQEKIDNTGSCIGLPSYEQTVYDTSWFDITPKVDKI